LWHGILLAQQQSSIMLQVAVLQETGLYSCCAGIGIPQQVELVLRNVWQVTLIQYFPARCS
jgi:hypothetical protein